MTFLLPLNTQAEAGSVANPDGSPSQVEKNLTSMRVIVKFKGATGSALVDSTARRTSSTTRSSSLANTTLGRLLDDKTVAKIEPLFPEVVESTARQGATARTLANEIDAKFPQRAARAPLGSVVPDLTAIYTVELRGDTPAQLDAIVKTLRRDPDVVYAKQEELYHVDYTPNDPYYATGLYGLTQLGASSAWDSVRGTNIIIAVVDTGVDYTHPDILSNLWTNPLEIAGNGIDDDHNGYIDDIMGWDFAGRFGGAPVESNDPFDRFGHGTHVAGTIAAEGNNGIGIIGVAPTARVMAVKGLADDGRGSDSSLAKAIVYAVNQGADVINASWGGSGSGIDEALAYAHAHGVVFVAAAGNNNQDTHSFSPASSVHVLTVSANDDKNAKAGFSNWGSKLDLSAPGVDILSLHAGYKDYILSSGTSMAAPHVSGVAALVLSQHPTNYSIEQVRQVLRSTATDLGLPGKDSSFGYGEVHAGRAVMAPIALEAKLTRPLDGTNIMAPIEIAGFAQGPGFSNYILEWGEGERPTSWTPLASGSAPVSGGLIGIFDPSLRADGIHTIRLRVQSTSGVFYYDHIQVVVNYIAITNPQPPRHYSFTAWRKPGLPIQISGLAQGKNFQSYRIEWAPGLNPTGGWATTGVVLANGGTRLVLNDLLGTWTPPASVKGDYALRLVVQDGSVTRTTTTNVYLEPDLATSNWPRVAEFAGPLNFLLPVKKADGSARLVLPTPSSMWSFDRDGAWKQADALKRSMYPQAVAGSIDAEPGEKMVFASGNDPSTLRVYSPDLTLLRSITHPSSESFSLHRSLLADLDGDGRAEIIALSDEWDLTTHLRKAPGAARKLYVHRGDGQPFSSRYPLALQPQMAPGSPFILHQWHLLAVDLNGDGKKEIIVAQPTWVSASSAYCFQLLAFNADGSVYPGWTAPLLETNGNISVLGNVSPLSVADFDGDGTQELLYTSGVGSNRAWVIERSGAVRAGWPRTVPIFGTSPVLADIDADGRPELVWLSGQALTSMKSDGVVTSVALGADIIPGNSSELSVADIDRDGVPEILIHSLVINPDRTTAGHVLVAVHPDGSVARRWKLFSALNEHISSVATTVGDFNGDGKTDIACYMATILGGEPLGDIVHGTVSMLSPDLLLDTTKHYWPIRDLDAQASRTLAPETAGPPPTAAPSITVPTTGIFTNQLSLQIIGKAEANSTVRIYRGGTLVGTVTALTNGIFALKINLVEGMNELAATAQKTGSGVSPLSAKITVVYDNTTPSWNDVKFNGIPFVERQSISVNGVFSINASDDRSGVAKVIFTLDGVLQKEDTDGSDGYTVPFSATTATGGAHELKITVVDRAGNGGSQISEFFVTTLPSPVITNPAQDFFASGTTVISGTTEPGLTVTLRRGTVVVGSGVAINSGQFSAQFNPIEGINDIVAVAQNAAGAVSAPSRPIRIIGDFRGPVVTAVTFNDGPIPSTITTNGTFKVVASDSAGVGRTLFWLNGSLIKEDLNAADGFSTSFSLAAARPGPNQLLISVIDLVNNATNTTVTFTVSN